MPQTNQIYKCKVCGKIIEILNPGNPETDCCGQAMELLEPKPKETEGKEKHVPVIEATKTGYKIKVGSVPHPMLAEHYIQWIEILADGASYKTFLKPDMAPEAEFCVKAEKITARIYCNVHGLWQNEN
jgi:superoxide reductase